VTLEAAMDSAPRQLRVKTSPENLENIVERQGEALAQFDREALLLGSQRGVDLIRTMRAVLDIIATAPSLDGVGIHAQLARQLGGAGHALLDIGPRRRSGRRQLVKPCHHGFVPNRSATNRIPAIIAGFS